MPLNLTVVKEKAAQAEALAAEAGQAREQLLVVGVCHSSAEHIRWMGHATESFSGKEERKKKEAEALSLAAEAGQARGQLLVVGVCHSSAEHNMDGSCH